MDFITRLTISLNYNLYKARNDGDLPNPKESGRCLPCLTAVETTGQFGVGPNRTYYFRNPFEGGPWGRPSEIWNGRAYVANK